MLEHLVIVILSLIILAILAGVVYVVIWLLVDVLDMDFLSSAAIILMLPVVVLFAAHLLVEIGTNLIKILGIK